MGEGVELEISFPALGKRRKQMHTYGVVRYLKADGWYLHSSRFDEE